jgi:hypothetical protein
MVASAGTAKWPGGVVARTERGLDRLRRIGGPLGDPGHRPGAGQDRGGSDGQDGDERMAAATGSPGVGDGSQIGEQARGVAVLEGIDVGELGQEDVPVAVELRWRPDG